MKTVLAVSAIILVITICGCSTTTYRGAEVRDRISVTPGLATHNISIDEEPAGNITLSGNVGSDKDREIIEKVARNTSGVENLRSNLVIDPSSIAVHEGSSSISNDDRYIVSEITSQIGSSAQLRDYHLLVESNSGIVTLRGEVGNENERAVAERIARNARSVSSVRNDIVVTQSARSDFQLSQNVRAALGNRRDISSDNIEVTTRDAIVTLRGTQSSKADIDYIVSTAESVRGVRAVRNEMLLTYR